MPLDFYREGSTKKPESDLDTGTNRVESVKHIEDGNPLDGENLQRSPENLRDRSEDIRERFDDLELVGRSDRALIVMSDVSAKVHLQESGGQFWFSLSDTGAAGTYNKKLIIGPVVSAALETGNQPVLASYYYDDSSDGEFKIATTKKVYEGAHNIYFRIFKGTQSLANPIVTVEGKNSSAPCDPLEGPVIITVEVSSGNNTTISQVVSEIQANVDVNPFVTATVEGSSSGNFVTDDLAPVRIYDGSDASVGGIDGEIHVINSTVLEEFFVTNSVRLQNGEALVIDYADAKERMSAAGDNLVTTGDLHIIGTAGTGGSVDTRNAADCQGTIPVCKMLNNRLYFMNGKSFVVDTPDYLVPGTASAGADDLRTDLAVQTGSPDGDFLVGAVAKSGTPNSLAQGTVDSQLAELLVDVNGAETAADSVTSDYAAHVAGTADEHPLKDITDKVFVTVGTNGDYTDLGAAILAKAAVGGVIFVDDGSYKINIEIASMVKDVRIIGRSNTGPTVSQFSAASPAIKVTDTTPTGRLIFENIKFDNTDNANVEVLQFPSYGTGFGAQFKNCYFFKNNGSTTKEFIECGCDALFEDCTIVNNTSAEDLPFFVGYAPTGSSDLPVFDFTRCYFQKWGELVRLGGTGEDETGKFRFVGNTIEECGNTSGDSSAGLLIATETGYRSHVNIADNSWVEDTGAASNENGLFCNIYGSGVIQNNMLTQGLRQSTADAGYYIVTARGYGRKLSVRGNTIEARYAGCIHTISFCSVDNNHCGTITSKTTAAIVVGSDCVCKGNYVDFMLASTSANAAIAIASYTAAVVQYALVADNIIHMGDLGTKTGIYVGNAFITCRAEDITITGNTILAGSDDSGINVYDTGSDSTRVVISNNVIKGCVVGVSIKSTHSVCNNNVITLHASTALRGIHFVLVAQYGAVIGNVIYGRNTSDFGITVDPANVAIAANTVLNVVTAFSGTAVSAGTSGIGTGSSRVTTHNVY